MATRTPIILAAFFAIATPAVAAPTCHIVVADDRASTLEIYRHELAHCWGWTHADQGHAGRPVKGYQSPKPPSGFVKPYPNLEARFLSTREALRLCGSYGCQWFGE